MAKIRPAILIVENDQATREMYQRALNQDYQVVAVSDTFETATLREMQPLQAVVLEPGPAGGRGWALLADLKRHPQTRLLPIILCTAQDERRRGLEMGAAAYLVKPVLPAALLEMLHRIMAADGQEGVTS